MFILKEKKILKTIERQSEAVFSSSERQASYQAAEKSFNFIDVPARQNIELAIGNAVPLTINDDSFPGFYFAIAVLGNWGGFTGRLMQTVREKEGLTYSIYARTEGFTSSLSGHWRIFTFFDPSVFSSGISSIKKQLSLLHNKGITDDELTRFKSILHTRDVLLRDSIERYTDFLHYHAKVDLSLQVYTELQERLQDLTQSDVNQAIRNHLSSDSLKISAAGPVQQVGSQLRAHLT